MAKTIDYQESSWSLSNDFPSQEQLHELIIESVIMLISALTKVT